MKHLRTAVWQFCAVILSAQLLAWMGLFKTSQCVTEHPNLDTLLALFFFLGVPAAVLWFLEWLDRPTLILPAKRWSKYYPRCVECGKTDKPCHGHGLCSRCYDRLVTRPSRRSK